MTSSMLFPWERRQFSEDNKGLRTWEKVYWGVFVTAISALLFSRIVKPTPKAEPVCLASSLKILVLRVAPPQHRQTRAKGGAGKP